MAVFLHNTARVVGDTVTPKKYLRELRRADPFIRYGVLAAHEILLKADLSKEDSSNCGLVVASAFGPMETNFDVLHQVVEKAQTSPTLFSHSVFNAAAGYLARIFGLHGPAFTLTDFAFPFFQALLQGTQLLKNGSVTHCLVIQIETYSHLLTDVRHQQGDEEKRDWAAGACAALISCTPGNFDRVMVEELLLDTTPAPPQGYFSSAGRMEIDTQNYPSDGPLDSAINFCDFFAGHGRGSCALRLTSPYGKLLLRLQR